MYSCKFCNNEYIVERSRRSHQTRCILNPDRKEPVIDYSKRTNRNQFTKAKEDGKVIPDAWNKGVVTLGKPHSAETKAKLSQIAKENGYGGVRQSSRIKYKDKWLGSSYELAVAMDLDENNVAWDTCKKFNYIDPNGVKRTYTPDFYLHEYDVYLDPKNDFLIENINPALGFTDQIKIELAAMQNNIKVFILNKTQLSWIEIQKIICC